MSPRILSPILVAALLSPASAWSDESSSLKRLRIDADHAGAAAVVVPVSSSLVHTSRVLPLDDQGEPAADDRQIDVAFDRLEAVLHAAGSDVSRVVRLHVVLERDDWTDAVRAAFAKRLKGHEGPAWTFVGGGPLHKGALIAVDAVATTDARPENGSVSQTTVAGFPAATATFAVDSGGARVFISGQAEQDEDLGAATRKTLQSLEDSLRVLGISRDRTVQLKAFIQPSTPEAAAVVEQETAAFFDGEAPPLVLVGWLSSAAQPIEIELVADATEIEAPDLVSYPPLPPLDQSPVFSRAALVGRGSLVYVSGLVGPSEASLADQVPPIFDALRTLLDEVGSDFRHMAKATYYVVSSESDASLNALRPTLYDPARPPAASKARVESVGLSGRGIAIDMITVAP